MARAAFATMPRSTAVRTNGFAARRTPCVVGSACKTGQFKRNSILVAMRPDYEKFIAGITREKVRTVARLGVELAPGLDVESWSQLVAHFVKAAGRVARNRDTLTAWLGDVLAYGGGKYHGQIAEYARAAGMSPGTLRDA